MTYQKLKRRKIENMKTVVQTDLLNSSPVSSVASDKSIVDPVVIDLLEVANQLA